MLSYRNVLFLLLLCSFLTILLAWIFLFLNFWLILIFFLLNIAWLITGSFLVCSNLYMKVRCAGESSTKSLSLSFDDGPHPDITPKVLDLLKAHNIKAIFFVNGKQIPGNEQLLQRIIHDGHVVGNHSWSHSNSFGFFSTKKVIDDLKQNEALIYKVIGKKPGLFRPPFGVTNPNIAKAARFLDYQVVGWSIRSLDTVIKNKDKTIRRVLRRLKAGRIILFHDNRAGIIPILEKVIDQALAKGYMFIPLEEMLNIKAYRE